MPDTLDGFLQYYFFFDFSLKFQSYYFYSLLSGMRLHRTHWTPLPMPAEVQDRVHALARHANAHRGLSFTDGHGNDLDELFPDDDSDSDFEPDDDASDASDDSDSNDSDNHDPRDPNLPELAGVDEPNDSIDDDNDVDDGATDDNDADNNAANDDASINDEDDDAADDPEPTSDAPHPPGVAAHHPVDTTGVDRTHLEDYVQELEAELDHELADIDNSVYDPTKDNPNTADTDLDDSFHPVDDNEATNLKDDAAREQAAADLTEPPIEDDDSSEADDDNEPEDAPLPRLRRNRTPNYSHLKGREGDGSLPTVARPKEFKSNKHSSHVILQISS